MVGMVNDYVVGRVQKATGMRAVSYWVHWETDGTWTNHGSGVVIQCPVEYSP